MVKLPKNIQERLDVVLIQHLAEAVGLEVNILPVLGDCVAGSVAAQLDRPSQLLEQSAAFLFECGSVCVA